MSFYELGATIWGKAFDKLTDSFPIFNVFREPLRSQISFVLVLIFLSPIILFLQFIEHVIIPLSGYLIILLFVIVVDVLVNNTEITLSTTNILSFYFHHIFALLRFPYRRIFGQPEPETTPEEISHPSKDPSYIYRFPLGQGQLQYLDAKCGGDQPFVTHSTLRDFNARHGQIYPMEWLYPLRLASKEYWKDHQLRVEKKNKRKARKLKKEMKRYFWSEDVSFIRSFFHWLCPCLVDSGIPAFRHDKTEPECKTFLHKFLVRIGRVPKPKAECEEKQQIYKPVFLKMDRLLWAADAAKQYHHGVLHYDKPILEKFNKKFEMHYRDEAQLRRAIHRSSKLSFASLAWNRKIEGLEPPFRGEFPEPDDWVPDWYDSKVENKTEAEEIKEREEEEEEEEYKERGRHLGEGPMARVLDWTMYDRFFPMADDDVARRGFRQRRWV